LNQRHRIRIEVACLALAFPLIAMASPFGSLFAGTRPAHVGSGALAPCPSTPNCVLSTSSDEHAIAPLAFVGDAADAWRRLEEIAKATPRATLIVNRPGYLYIEVASAALGFVDDVEFVLDASAGVIDVRSASRLGRSDFGVNRARIEAMRATFEGSPPAGMRKTS
jgi:uncharacterized protein (DUF1499 family)